MYEQAHTRVLKQVKGEDVEDEDVEEDKCDVAGGAGVPCWSWLVVVHGKRSSERKDILLNTTCKMSNSNTAYIVEAVGDVPEVSAMPPLCSQWPSISILEGVGGLVLLCPFSLSFPEVLCHADR